MHTTKEVMAVLGVKSESSFWKKVRKHGIVPLKQWRYCFFTEEMISDLKNDRRRGRPRTKAEIKPCKRKTASAGRKKAPRYCWRVSIWNDELMCYVVAKCGLTRKEADELIAGKNAVKRPCWR